MKTVDVVLPVYDEEEGIEAFHHALTEAVRPLENRYAFHFIYVLDRCTDNSLGVLKSLVSHCPRMTLLQLSSRFGHQMSLVAGIDRSRGDAVIMMDCDLQHPPDRIPLLLEKFEEGYDVVQAIRSYDISAGWFKQRSSRLFYWLQNALSPINIQDGAADFRLISGKVAKVFQTGIRERNQFLRGLFEWVGFHRTTVSIVSPPRSAGRTKYRLLQLFAFSVAGITSFSKVPLRLATFSGIVLSCVSLSYGVWLAGSYVLGGSFPLGYTSLIVVVLFIGGLQLMFLGILGEYLGSVFDEVKARPLYIVDEIVESADR